MAPGTTSNQFLNGRAPQPNVPNQRRSIGQFQQRSGHPPVIAAQFGDRSADARAKATLARLYPGREIVMLDTDPIGESGGGIHCATHEQPRV